MELPSDIFAHISNISADNRLTETIACLCKNLVYLGTILRKDTVPPIRSNGTHTNDHAHGIGQFDVNCCQKFRYGKLIGFYVENLETTKFHYFASVDLDDNTQFTSFNGDHDMCHNIVRVSDSPLRTLVSATSTETGLTIDVREPELAAPYLDRFRSATDLVATTLPTDDILGFLDRLCRVFL